MFKKKGDIVTVKVKDIPNIPKGTAMKVVQYGQPDDDGLLFSVITLDRKFGLYMNSPDLDSLEKEFKAMFED